MNIFRKLFKKKIIENVKEESLPKKEIDLSNITQFDDVWIKIGDCIYEGWVVERIGNTISIIYTNKNNKLEDAIFVIHRPFNRSFIEQNDKILYLDKNEIDKNV